jgi:hypothetical protein
MTASRSSFANLGHEGNRLGTGLTHQDIGQMESYVRMFDAHARPEGDNPTIMFKEERGDREVFGAEQGPSDLRRQEELDVQGQRRRRAHAGSAPISLYGMMPMVKVSQGPTTARLQLTTSPPPSSALQ